MTMEKLQDFFKISLGDFLDTLASNSPTPGGGSTAALSGAMAAGLVSMVCNLTIGRAKYAQYEEIAKEALIKSEQLRKNLMQCVIDDINEYNNVMSAFKISKEDPERSNKIQDAYKQAIEPPKNTVMYCGEVVNLAKDLIGKTNAAAVSDLYSAIYLARCGVLCADENITINLNAIKDSDFTNNERIWAKVHKDSAF